MRQVVFKHFAGSAVSSLETAQRITVEDCQALAPVSEIGGERRYTFLPRGNKPFFKGSMPNTDTTIFLWATAQLALMPLCNASLICHLALVALSTVGHQAFYLIL
ncbi:MAG: hypothetical protein R2822_21285 [Spirosomataceae bacterium]